MTFDKVFTALNVIFTGLSVVAAVFALRQSKRADRKAQALQDRQLKIEDRLLQIEEAREQDRLKQSKTADLVAGLEKLANKSYRFSINNRGQGMATDISIRFDGELPSAYHVFDQHPFPDSLDGGRSHNVQLYLSQAFLPEHVEISWVNESGERKVSEDNLIWS